MTPWSLFLVALREIRRNTLRSALTTLGIMIGVAAVIALLTLGQGAASTVTGSISALGRNLLIAAPGGHSRMGPTTDATPFGLDDVETVGREVPGAAAVAPVAMKPLLAIYGNENWPTSVIGTDNGYLAIREWPLAAGRAFTEEELLAGRMVCIVGATVRQHLFGAQDPLEASIRLGSLACRVVGVLEAKGQGAMGVDQDDAVLLPIRAFHRRIAGNRDVGFIYISAQSSAGTARVQEEVTRVLRERRPVAYGEEEDFHVHDMKEITGLVTSVTGVLTALLGAIAAISLLVGGIGIMNIMLVSVTERTREIGIRLAIGALGGEVLRQFLAEALLLSLTGGLLGIGLGLASSAVAARALNVGFSIDLSVVGLAFLFSGLVGVAFGYLPARKAARLDPIEALRHE